MPIPGNAEFALYVVALEIVLAIIWLFDDASNVNDWCVLRPRSSTAAYLLSRGIAKASRVLEQ